MATGGESNLFECTICLEEFQDPKLLPCFHTFCKRCLSTHIKKCRRRNIFPCPNCRTDINVPAKEADGFQTNFYITAAKENLHSKLLDIGAGTKKKKGAEKGDSGLFEQPCPKHGNQNQMLQFYCAVCDVPICLHCKLTSHEGHHTKDLEDILHKTTDELKEQSDKIQSYVLLYQAARATAENAEKIHGHKLQEVKASIIQNAEQLHEMVDNRKKILLDLLTKSQKKETNKVVQYKRSLDKHSKQMERLMKQVNSDQNKHDVMALLKFKSTVSEEMKTFQTTPPAYDSNGVEVNYACTPNLKRKAHDMISSFMGQVIIPNIEPPKLQSAATVPPETSRQSAAGTSSPSNNLTHHIPTLLRTIWRKGRSKYTVRNLSTDHKGCLWAIYDPMSPDIELLNRNGATLKKLTIKGYDLSGLTFIPNDKLLVCCPSQKVLISVNNILSETPTRNLVMSLPDTPIATHQYDRLVYVLIWGNKGLSTRGIYCTDTKKWLIKNPQQQIMMKKPIDFVVTKVNGKMTIIVSDPLAQKVFYFQEVRGDYSLLNVFKGEGAAQYKFLPKCISLTDKGHILVADEHNNCIVQLDIKTGKLIGVIDLESILIQKPRTVRYTQEGTWIGDCFGGLYLIQ